jgi:hypothetical protein
MDSIQKNFIQLNIIFDEPRPYVIKDIPSMTADSLLSSFGGTLSLWLGITVMFLVEIADLVIGIVFGWLGSQVTTTSPTASNDVEQIKPYPSNAISVSVSDDVPEVT